MSITLDEFVEEAAQLPADVSAELVERILIRRHGGIEPVIEAEWMAEIRTRVAEITEGRVQEVSLEDALARAARALPR